MYSIVPVWPVRGRDQEAERSIDDPKSLSIAVGLVSTADIQERIVFPVQEDVGGLGKQQTVP